MPENHKKQQNLAETPRRQQKRTKTNKTRKKRRILPKNSNIGQNHIKNAVFEAKFEADSKGFETDSKRFETIRKDSKRFETDSKRSRNESKLALAHGIW